MPGDKKYLPKRKRLTDEMGPVVGSVDLKDPRAAELKRLLLEHPTGTAAGCIPTLESIALQLGTLSTYVSFEFDRLFSGFELQDKRHAELAQEVASLKGSRDITEQELADHAQQLAEHKQELAEQRKRLSDLERKVKP